ncbi:MAG TPA: TIGR00730 family Rossman fold protein [Polyangiaceae bacterium]|jgi:hypothetical protein|nr:TIGR00730 family Rossman fold protein [Polyangiaceae bacterium]
MPRLCVFCGSSMGTDPAYAEAARALGRALAERGAGLVYGGAHRGLMGLLADSVLENGGTVIGVIPERLVELEVAHRGLTEQHVVKTMHERKALMAAHADAFLALPGGFGTLEEFMEVLTWAQLGYHDKPLGMLNISGYYDGLLSWIGFAERQGLVSSTNTGRIRVSTNVAEALAQLL